MLASGVLLLLGLMSAVANESEVALSYRALLDLACPEGLVIPDNFERPDIVYINRTMSDCALACRIPMFTASEWRSFDSVSTVAVSVGIPMVVLLLYVYFFDPDKRQLYLVQSFGFLSLVHSILTLVVQTTPFDDMFCSSNASWITAEDGFTMCAVQSVGQLYVSFGLALSWLLQAYTVFMKVVWENRSSPWRQLHLAIIFGAPIIPVAAQIATRSYGYTKGNFGCLFSSSVRDTHEDIFILFAPLAVICSIGYVLLMAIMMKMFSVFGTYVKVYRRKMQIHTESYATEATPSGTPNAVASTRTLSNEMFEPPGQQNHRLGSAGSSCSNDSDRPAYDGVNQQSIHSVPSSGGQNRSPARGMVAARLQDLDLQSMWDLVLYFRTPMVFVVLFFVVYLAQIVGGWSLSLRRNDFAEGLRVWGQCALDNYNGVDSSWHEVCGAHPATRISPTSRRFFSFVFGGQSLFLSIIYGPNIATFLHREYLALVRVVIYLRYGAAGLAVYTGVNIAPVVVADTCLESERPTAFALRDDMLRKDCVRPVPSPVAEELYSNDSLDESVRVNDSVDIGRYAALDPEAV
jgi:hypothetical protein